MRIRPIAGLAVTALAVAACSQEAPPSETAPEPPPAAPTVTHQVSPPGAMVYIIEPADGTTVTSPVRVAFGLKGMGVAPAGVERPNTGHHHLLIDTRLASFDEPIPADAQHVHFGAGQTETTIELEPGRHELQLVLGDHLHIPHDPPVVSEVVTIEVTD